MVSDKEQNSVDSVHISDKSPSDNLELSSGGSSMESIKTKCCDECTQYEYKAVDTYRVKRLRQQDDQDDYSLMWSLDSWKGKPLAQNPFSVPHLGCLSCSERELKKLPSLVNDIEVNNLLNDLRQVWEGKAFVLQCGECSELFSQCTDSYISSMIEAINTIAFFLRKLLSRHTEFRKIITIARLAGQYGKPRTRKFEVSNGKEVLAYHGDLVNGRFQDDRTPNADRLLKAYFYSATTLNKIRSTYNSNSLSKFLSKLTDTQESPINLSENDYKADHENAFLYTSHEAFLVPYESGLTRYIDGNALSTSAHMLWIGERTSQLDGGHVEFCRGLLNPIGLKVGPRMDPSVLVSTIKRLNPDNIPGKICVITRLGVKDVSNLLPGFIRTVQLANQRVIWMCDPMHGNTIVSPEGTKRRKITDILKEVKETFKIHRAANSHLGGLHLECTGVPIEECIEDGISKLDVACCDPRLNLRQSLQVVHTLWHSFNED